MQEQEPKISRRDQILQALAEMLEANPGGRITTANLAKHVGVSEAALYRHFPSKAKMFDGLIEFIEDTLFSRIAKIIKEDSTAQLQCEKIVSLILGFTEKNPGITRILTGDALAGETDRLRQRVAQLFDRIETQLKQVLREAEIREGLRTQLSVTQTANLIMVFTDGKISQFVRSEFKNLPTESWHEQWSIIGDQLFRA
ncbi:MAG: nucleoid occlusion factor SlmA [Pseudomonadales bacterium]|nr:nucleoid occlusion factor SlmA [Pseudomonadales bacterium]